MSFSLRMLPRASQTFFHSRPSRIVVPSINGFNNARSFTAAVTTHHNDRGSSRPDSLSSGSNPDKPSRPAPLPRSDEVPNSQSSQSSANPLPEFDLTKQIILITGAARGLGLTQASALLEAGATVYALDRLPEPSPSFSQLQTHATSLNTKLHYRHVDVRDVAALNGTITQIADEEGRMDGLIAAAGIQQETPALEYTAEDADKMLGVNVTGVFMTAQAVARQMIRFQTPGSIALIASMSGHVANRGLICPAYNASKAAVIQLARNLASEWGGYGIRVNTISPGYIVTDMVEELFRRFPERREEWPRQNMLGRLSRPEEYRGAAVFLMSKASSFMTGADLRMDGGHTAW